MKDITIYLFIYYKLFNRIIIFKEALQLFYNFGRLLFYVITWKLQIIVDFLLVILSTCVVNQSCGHLLSDALYFVISIGLKLTEKINWIPLVENVICNDSAFNIELGLLAFNIKNEVYYMFDYFLSFSRKHEWSNGDMVIYSFFGVFMQCVQFFQKNWSMQFSPKLFWI